MVFEDGVDWRPLEPDKRGRHATFRSAVKAAVSDLVVQHDPFFDSLADRWGALFPNLPAKPGRYEDGLIFIYVRSAAASYVVRPKLRAIARRLAALSDAPKKIDLRLEIHAS